MTFTTLDSERRSLDDGFLETNAYTSPTAVKHSPSFCRTDWGGSLFSNGEQKRRKSHSGGLPAGAFGHLGSNNLDDLYSAAWFALHVRSRHEKAVHAQLEAKKHHSFLPLYVERSRWADRDKNIQLPLFPGYVFCYFPQHHRPSVIATSGVIDVVRSGQEPAAIESSVIISIQRIVASGACAEPYPQLAVGDDVALTRGALAGLAGKLIRIKNRLRFVVSVELLCRSVMLEVEPDAIVKCDRASHTPATRPSFRPVSI